MKFLRPFSLAGAGKLFLALLFSAVVLVILSMGECGNNDVGAGY